MEKNLKIGVVTPLKNELSNIPLLIESITSQSTNIYYWVIVENGSTDGSKEYLDAIKQLKNVDNLKILNFSLPNEKYELGIKYATVVNEGFKYLFSNGIIDSLDFVGILDADCFPSPGYYKELVEFMNADERIGISSGLAYSLDGVYDNQSKNWVRGNCRLWKQKCFLECGYIIGPSADTLSACKAELKGWKVIPNKRLVYRCREVGQKVNFSYYGYSAYFRGIRPWYALFKTVKYFIVGKIPQGQQFYKGYFSSLKEKRKRVNDPEILNYFFNYGSRKLNKLFKQ